MCPAFFDAEARELLGLHRGCAERTENSRSSAQVRQSSINARELERGSHKSHIYFWQSEQ